MNKVVARYADGRVRKGMTADFFPNKDVFHMTDAAAPGSGPIEVWKKDLKALFFVKDLIGDPQHVERKQFAGAPVGRAIKVVFSDGEELIGTTTGYQPGRPGFFVVPADPDSNNERIYVVTAATREVGFF